MSVNRFSAAALAFAVVAAAPLAIAFTDDVRPTQPAVHRRISTISDEAQREFDRGLLLVYAFDHAEAIKAFSRAAELDPHAAMPQWGIALALGPNINEPRMEGRMAAAAAASRRAVDLARDQSARDRGYAAALAARYTDAPGYSLRALAAAYANAMRALSLEYRDDPDAAALFAESLMLSGSGPLWHDDGHAGDGTDEAIAAVQRAIAVAPSHVGAHHYYIHLVEDSPDPGRALPSARLLDAFTTGPGHLLHMPSHIYVRVGDYRAAVASSERAVAADHAHDGSADARYRPLQTHAREFLSAAASMTGQYAVAKRATNNLFVLLRFGRWDDVLAFKPIADPVAVLEWRAAQVVALLGARRLEDAERASAEYDVAERALPNDARWWFDPIGKALPLFHHEIAARFAGARGDFEAAIAEWRAAVQAQDRLTRGEVPPWPWFHPTRESLGATLYRAGRFAEAEATFREDLVRNPGNPRSLYGLAASLRAQHRDVEAAAIRSQFEVAWKDADVELSMESL
jgi:tetratricopeptide (TPR) repeat protein